jgi:drug/metabolite transporter (DMT)-like permease
MPHATRALVARIGRHRLVAAVAAVYVLWGSTYLAVALGLRSIPPLMLMGARSLLGGAILLAIAWGRGRTLPSVRAWPLAALAGLLLFVGCHGTLAYAQQRVPSGLAAVMLATIPFWIVLINLVVPTDKRPTIGAVAGLTPGLAGVALIAWRGSARDATAAIEPTMILLLLLSAFAWAAGSLVSQRQGRSTPALPRAGMQLVSGGTVLLVLSALAGEWNRFAPDHVTGASWASLAYLALAGSVLAFTAYVWLLDHAPAPLVATYTFVNPIIAVVLGWTLLGERLGASTLLGMALVIASVVAVWRLDREAGTSRRDQVADRCAGHGSWIPDRRDLPAR